MVPVVQESDTTQGKVLNMKAIINHPLAVKAAGNIANGGYKTSRFEIRREGENVCVSGTNGYSSISIIFAGSFSRWPDGKSITLGPAAVRAMMRGIGASLKKTESVCFEHTAGSGNIRVSCDIDSAAIETIVELDDVRSCESFNWEGTSKADDGCDCPKVSAYFMDCAARAMKTAGIAKCDIVWDNGDRALILKSEAEDMKACALVSLAR